MELTKRHPYACAAEILRCDSETDATRARRLIEQGCEKIDTLFVQLSGLIQSREPARKMDETAVKRAVADFLAQRQNEYGVWAHYPWSRRLVRLLEEPEFVDLRTDRNRQKITRDEHARLGAKKVGVVGLSVGQAVALTFALERSCGELRLADFDDIELSNLNRLRCGVHELGLPKTVVAARQIAELDPYLKVVCFDEGYSEANAADFFDGLDLVVDECDSLDAKLRLRAAARARRVPVLMNTSDRGMTDIERFDLEPERPLFHGKIGDLAPDSVAGLSTEEKVPFVLDIIGLETSSVRLRASMLEIEQSIKTWPQLASDVALGGAAVCDAGRRLLLGMPVASGRYYMDLASLGASSPAADLSASATIVRAETAPLAAGDDVRDRIVADACLAPSAGNAQPWQWIKTDEGLLLKHRRSPGRSLLYFEDRAAMVGLGAALESALLAAAEHGQRADLHWRWQGDDIVSIALTAQTQAKPDPLHTQIVRRRSVRTRASAASPIPETALNALASQVRRFEGFEVEFLVDGDAIRTLADLVADAERLRMLDPESHADLIHEIAWSESGHRCDGEGIPMSALSLSAAEQAGLRVLADARVAAQIAEWDLGAGLGKLARELVASSSAVGLIWCPAETQADYLQGGRALLRLWLEATRADIGLCPITSLCYLLRAGRRGRSKDAAQEEALQTMERRFRGLFALPDARADIALFRLVPAAGALDGPRVTRRRPGLN